MKINPQAYQRIRASSPLKKTSAGNSARLLNFSHFPHPPVPVFSGAFSIFAFFQSLLEILAFPILGPKSLLNRSNLCSVDFLFYTFFLVKFNFLLKGVNLCFFSIFSQNLCFFSIFAQNLCSTVVCRRIQNRHRASSRSVRWHNTSPRRRRSSSPSSPTTRTCMLSFTDQKKNAHGR
jgi:hypothetical protein